MAQSLPTVPCVVPCGYFLGICTDRTWEELWSHAMMGEVCPMGVAAVAAATWLGCLGEAAHAAGRLKDPARRLMLRDVMWRSWCGIVKAFMGLCRMWRASSSHRLLQPNAGSAGTQWYVRSLVLLPTQISLGLQNCHESFVGVIPTAMFCKPEES